MKLTEKKNIKFADRGKLAENEIYKAFQTTYNDVFNNVPEIEICQYSISDQSFDYHKNSSEDIFYKDKYINLREECANLETLGITIPDNIRHNIGNAKKDLLDFTYNLDSKVAAQFKGDRGWGKTTILRYLFFHTIPLLNKLNEKKVIPIYLSFNRMVNDLKKEKDEKEIINTFYNTLSEKIRHCYADILANKSSAFLNDLIQQEGFSEYKIKLQRIDNKNINARQKEEMQDKIYDEIIKNNDAILHCLAYTAHNNKLIPIIILDDLDPLDTNVVELIFNEIYKITRRFRVKVIYTIRPLTYKKITRIADFTNTLLVDLVKPELLDAFLKKFIHILIDKIGDSCVSEIKLGNKIITITDAKRFYSNFLKILTQDRSRELLDNLTNGDIRLYKELVKTCLGSGWINSEELIGKLIDEKFDTNKYVPYWIVYTSIITQNHKLIFPSVKGHNNEHIISLLCNGGESFHTYFMRLHLLSYFMKIGNAARSFDEIMEVFQSVFVEQDSKRLSNSLHRAIRKLNNSRLDDEERKRAGLIHNEDKLFILENKDELKQKNFEFKVTNIGKYYYNTLITTFEYLSFMKDDVEFPDEIANTIQNNIEAKTLQQKFDAVVKYLNFLFEKEKTFIDSLKTETRIQSYKDNFTPSKHHNCVLFSELFVINMINYGRARKDNISNLSMIKTLNNEIDSYIKEKGLRDYENEGFFTYY